MNIFAMKEENGMRRMTRNLLSVLVLFLVLFPGSEAFADKSYQLKNVSIVADLSTDGSMQVVENRTYKFRGSYKYAFRTFPLGSGIEYSDFSVLENNQPYVLSDSEEPGTYKVTNADDEIEVRWYYRARNESRTFSLRYGVVNAVKRHLDAAVLYYKFIGEGFRKSTGNLEITVNPPSPLEKRKVRQWAHGPLWGSSETSDSGVVTATCKNLPKKKFFELRILYPAEAFGAAAEIYGYTVDKVVKEETVWVEAANLRRQHRIERAESLKARKKIGAWAMPLLLGLGVFWFALIARQYGKRPDIPSFPASSAEVPSDLPPAIVGYLITERTVSGSALMATMLDLARRGFLEFREEQELEKGFMGREKWKATNFWVLKKGYYQEHKTDLAEFEKMLVTFVFEKLADGENQNPDETVVSMKVFEKKKSKVQSFFGKWSEAVKKEGRTYNFFDQESFKGRNKGMILGIALMVIAIPCAFIFHAWALFPGVGGTILLISSLAIVHHNVEGGIQAKRWSGLKKYLISQGYKKNDPSGVLDSIEAYFVYGVVMGMQKNHFASLGNVIPPERHGAYMPWYHAGYGQGQGFSGDSFGASFSTAVTSVNSAMSSSTGAGGGATGGGGGGAGGGGGGAG